MGDFYIKSHSEIFSRFGKKYSEMGKFYILLKISGKNTVAEFQTSFCKKLAYLSRFPLETSRDALVASHGVAKSRFK